MKYKGLRLAKVSMLTIVKKKPTVQESKVLPHFILTVAAKTKITGQFKT